ncbi:MAG: acyl-CoA dehydrogenase family protein [Desulfobacterales bacterium]|nr:acyl-CoA dehydrogenase family protein [Desulfobacterales bacterium]
MDEKLSREHKMVLDAVRYWLKKKYPRTEAMAGDESGRLPPEILDSFKTLDFWAMGVDEAFGGTGRDWLGAGIVVETLAEMDPVLAGIYATDVFGGAMTISSLGTESQKKTWLPQLAQGKLSVARVTANRAKAETIGFSKDKKGWVLNGSAKHVAHAMGAKWLIIEAVDATDTAPPGFFIVAPTSEGLTLSPADTLGFRSAGIGSIVLKKACLPPEAMLGDPHDGSVSPRVLSRIQGAADLAGAAQAVGMAQGAMDYALAHARSRVQFNQPIGRFPALREKFVNLSVAIRAARLLVRSAAIRADTGQDFATEAAQALVMASATAEKAGLEGIQILGGYGYTLEYDAQRYLRNAMQLACTMAEKSARHETIGRSLGLGP